MSNDKKKHEQYELICTNVSGDLFFKLNIG